MPAVRRDRIVFFGTPAFALPTLAALVEASREPSLVVTQPPRPAGRGRALQEPPTAAWARQRGLEVAAPERVRDPAFLARLAALEPDLAVVVAFGQIFPPELLELPRHGCLNVHASLLPRHRGAAPVQAAILAGDVVTGVCTMQMDAGLDTGPVLLRAETRLGGRETTVTLAPRLAHLGAALLLETLDCLEAGELAPVPQPAAGATYAPRLTKQDGLADWSASADELFRRLRALAPWPGLHTRHAGEPLKILWAEPADRQVPPAAAAGEIVAIGADGVAIACGGGGTLRLVRVQRPGRQAVAAEEWARGAPLTAGARLDA